MKITNRDIDSGKPFDWGKTSLDFELVHHEEFTLRIPFTHDNWNGRMKACRGIGASLTEKEISMWEQEHRILLEHIAPNEFDILHYGAIAELKKC